MGCAFMEIVFKAMLAVLCLMLIVCGCGGTENIGGQSDVLSIDETVSSTPSLEEVSSVVPEEPSSSEGTSSTETVSSKVSVPSDVPIGGTHYIGKLYTERELLALDNTKRGYGHGSKKDSDNRPTGATWAQSKFGKYNAVFIAPKSEYIYLTFDLGYENGYTEKILDVLKEKNAKGVFFVTKSYCKSSPNIVKRIIDEGHVLGNHSVKHKSMPTLSLSEMQKEIMDLHDYIKETYNYEMTLFRPPMGEYSERSLALTQSLGYQSMLWSFAYMDWDTEDQPEITYAKNKMLNDAHGGAIYLIHAISKTNAEILGEVIDGMREKGYKTAKYEVIK